jgi:hypothetical protein
MDRPTDARYLYGNLCIIGTYKIASTGTYVDRYVVMTFT